ncbi:MAG: AAA family ATPase [Desulfovibrio sp.]|nr:AAA family ATPase [Desulfovibrio sp.]
MSKIFGEMFSLLEKDKRGPENSIGLLHGGEDFSVPKNLRIIGTMNTADRGLAMLDYALRRRFAFYDLKPAFASGKFEACKSWLNNPVFDKLIEAVKELKEDIVGDGAQGEGFCVGHSYFCGFEPDESLKPVLRIIVERELIPLIGEYWFDDREKLRDWIPLLKDIAK